MSQKPLRADEPDTQNGKLGPRGATSSSSFRRGSKEEG